MLRIVVYNPVKQHAEFISSQIKLDLMQLKSNFELSTYISQKRIMERIDQDIYWYDIFIIDADSSSRIVHKVRSKNLQASIILTTSKETEIEDFLKFRPSGWIKHLNPPEKLHECFKNVFNEQKSINPYFIIRKKDRIKRINIYNIDYIENDKRIVILHDHMNRERVEFYAKFDDIMHTLPKDVFIKCHQSFIVNMLTVRILDKLNRLLILNSGKTIPISRRLLPEVVKRFLISRKKYSYSNEQYLKV